MSGLIYWNPSQNDSSHRDAHEGNTSDWKHFSKLPNNEILAAYEDDFGFVWMPTPHGLIQFQISTGLSKIYSVAQGLTDSGFQEYAHAVAEDGTLYLGGYNGFNIFHPRNFKNVNFNSQVPLIITDFEQHNVETGKIEYHLEQMMDKKEIVMRPGEKIFNIRVTPSDYLAADKPHFAYKIEDYTEEWQETESNLIRIVGLPFGEYVLKIKGRMNDGLYAEPELKIPIRVLRPFYLKGWFVTFCALTLGLTLFVFFKRKTQNLIKQQKILELSVLKATETIPNKNESLEKDKQTIKLQAEELKQMDQLKSRFFANISHEFRTPLTLIIEPLRQIISKPTKEGWLRKIQLVERSSQKLLTLVNQLLDLAKLEDNRMTLDLRRGDILDTLRPIYQSFMPLADKKRIGLKFVVDKDLEPFYFDKDKIEKVVNNLMSNAVKFTKVGSCELRVEASRLKRQSLPNSQIIENLSITVSDTGFGIPQNELSKIFDRFHQADTSSTRNVEGTGIGLALTKELVELMGGEIAVESEIDKGSTFVVKLPMLREGVEITGTVDVQKSIELTDLHEIEPKLKGPISALSVIESIQSSPLGYTDRHLILLIEDNAEMRQFIKESLHKKYQIVEASNGEEGIKKAVELIPDLVVSDVMMPKKDGFELTDNLKNDEKTSHIPIVLLTAKSAIESKIKGFEKRCRCLLDQAFSHRRVRSTN